MIIVLEIVVFIMSTITTAGYYGGREGSPASREKSRLPPLKCRLPRARGNAKCRLPRFFYARQATFNIAACRARGRWHLALPPAACAESGILEAAGGFFRGWRLTLLGHHRLSILNTMIINKVLFLWLSAKSS